MFYDSDQHDPEAYHIMAENLAGYFKVKENWKKIKMFFEIF